MKWNNNTIPKNAKKGIICPIRDDWFQAECWACDFCGRNEAAEHGATFEFIKINGFSFFVDSIESYDGIIIKYGYKTIETEDGEEPSL